MIHFFRLHLYVVLVFIVVFGTSVHADDLIAGVYITPPKYIITENGNVEGLCIEIMRALEKTDPQIQFSLDRFMPFSRVMDELRSGVIDVYIGGAWTEEREKIYIYLQPPIYDVDLIMAVRSDDTVDVDSFDEIRSLEGDKTILSLFGTTSSKYILAQDGLKVDNDGKSLEENLDKLLYPRARFFFYHDLSLNYIVKQDAYKDKVRLLPHSYKHHSHYIVFSPMTPKSKVMMVQAALTKISESGELAAIVKKYKPNLHSQ